MIGYWCHTVRLSVIPANSLLYRSVEFKHILLCSLLLLFTFYHYMMHLCCIIILAVNLAGCNGISCVCRCMNSQSSSWIWLSDGGDAVAPGSYYDSFSVSEVCHLCIAFTYHRLRLCMNVWSVLFRRQSFFCMLQTLSIDIPFIYSFSHLFSVCYFSCMNYIIYSVSVDAEKLQMLLLL